jgi:hypothetical protein
MDGKYQSRRDHKSKHKNKHKDERRSRKKESRGKARAMVGASDVDSEDQERPSGRWMTAPQ